MTTEAPSTDDHRHDKQSQTTDKKKKSAEFPGLAANEVLRARYTFAAEGLFKV